MLAVAINYGYELFVSKLLWSFVEELLFIPCRLLPIANSLMSEWLFFAAELLITKLFNHLEPDSMCTILSNG